MTATELLRDLIESQAMDEELWFNAETAPEQYLQVALRRLHGAVESFLSQPEPQAPWNEYGQKLQQAAGFGPGRRMSAPQAMSAEEVREACKQAIRKIEPRYKETWHPRFAVAAGIQQAFDSINSLNLSRKEKV